MHRPLLVLLALTACKRVTDVRQESFAADGVYVVSARMDAGDFDYLGQPRQDAFDVEGLRFGWGSNADKAQERLDGTQWSGSIDGKALLLDVTSQDSRSGVDLSVLGPEIVDLDVLTDSGSVSARNVEGIHVITADSLSGELIGDADIYTTGSVVLDFLPFVETDMVIDAGGDVTLYLPFGADYDLTVRTDGTEPLSIDDLGFDEVRLDAGYFNGFRTPGTVDIDISAGGDVIVRELR